MLTTTAALCTALLQGDLASLTLMYLGPEMFLPFASAVAAIVGALLMFWRYIVSQVRKFFRFVGRGFRSSKKKPRVPEHAAPEQQHSETVQTAPVHEEDLRA